MKGLEEYVERVQEAIRSDVIGKPSEALAAKCAVAALAPELRQAQGGAGTMRARFKWLAAQAEKLGHDPYSARGFETFLVGRAIEAGILADELKRLLGPARMVLDRCAEGVATAEEAAVMAQRIVDLIGHPVTDEPPHALVERDALRQEVERLRSTTPAESKGREQALFDRVDTLAAEVERLRSEKSRWEEALAAHRTSADYYARENVEAERMAQEFAERAQLADELAAALRTIDRYGDGLAASNWGGLAQTAANALVRYDALTTEAPK